MDPPSSSDRLIASARAHERAGRYTEAVRDLEHAALASAPCPGIWLRISSLQQAADRYPAAREACLVAAAQATGARGDAVLSHLLMRLLVFEETATIGTIVANADWNASAVVRQAAVVSQVLWLSGLHAEALAFLDHVEPQASPDHRLAFVRASVLRSLGQLDAATSEYRRSIALEPGFVDAHWALASHAPRDRADDQRAAIAQASRLHAAGAQAHVDLGYALFHVEDAAGRVDAAWTALKSAADLRHAHLGYDHAGHSEQVCRLLQESTAVAEAGTKGNADVRPIFVVGMPRTGTTLLERILGNHRDVAAAGELNAFAASIGMVTGRFPALDLSAEGSVRLGVDGLAAVAIEYLGRVDGLAGGRRCLVDKNPQNFYLAGLIARALPHARILCLVRDPADACFSNYKALFHGNTYGYSYNFEALAAHQHAFRRLVAHWERTLPRQFMVVRYESLVSDPLAESARVLAFCGLAADPTCVDIASNPNPVSTASSSQVRQPIRDSSIGAWARYATQLAPLIASLSEPSAGSIAETRVE